jgi:glycosyltransferase involved in cell wall biosynthesis
MSTAPEGGSPPQWPRDLRIAVLLPCFNEAEAIGAVVAEFRAVLPVAQVFVFDNQSTDDTAAVAGSAGAQVRSIEPRGKGNVVRRMFADVEADVYVMADGDGTYDAAAAPRMVGLLVADRLDMLVASRISGQRAAYRFGHRIGNRALTSFAAMIFGRTFSDMLSGYRVFSRRYAKSFPAHSSGFEIETELTVHALEMRMPVAEISAAYRARADGTRSKLSTYRDGARILLTILWLFRTEKPLAYYSIGCAVSVLAAAWLAWPIVQEYLATGLVPRLPTAVLCAALILLGAILLTCGIVLDTVSRGRAEAKRLAYLSLPGPGQSM